MRWKWRGLTGIRLEKGPDETMILNFRTGDGGGTHCAGSGGDGDRAARLAMEDDGAGLDVVTVIDAHAGGGAGGAVASIHRGYGPVPAVGKILVIPATGCGGMAQGHHLRLVAPVAQCPHSDGLDGVSVAGAAWGEHQGVLVTVRGGVGIHRDGGVVPVGDGHRVTSSRVCAQRHCVGLLHLGRAPRYR